jgi:hypothetical protein
MSVSAAFVVAIPGNTIGYNTSTVEEQFDAEARAYIILTPGLSVDVEGTTLTEWPMGAVWAKAHAQQLSILPELNDVEIIHRRTMPHIYLDMDTPAPIMGRPKSPKYWTRSTVDLNLTQYIGHLYAKPDTDPVWNSDTSSWDYPPPTGGVGNKRWTVKSMPDPATYPDEFYWVGERTAADGTSGADPRTAQWAGDTSTPSAEPWNSAYPYKPYLAHYRHYNDDDSYVDFPRSLHFNHATCAHMWMSTELLHQPITWMFVAIIYRISGFNHQHTLLDSGVNTTRNVHTPTRAKIQAGIPIYGHEGTNNAAFMGVSNDSQYGGTSFTRTKNPRAPRNAYWAPRVYFTVFNGTKTIVGNQSNKDKHWKTGTTQLDGTQFGNFIMGRKNGIVDTKSSAQMILFEVRFWSRALSAEELNAQYAQLSSTWKFSQFK